MPFNGQVTTIARRVKDFLAAGCRHLAKISRARWRWYRSFLKDVWLHSVEDRLPMAAAAIAFFSLLSIIPLFGLALSIAIAFSLKLDLITTIEKLSIDFGPTVSAVLQNEVLNVVKARGILTGVALVIGLWTGSQVFLIMESVMGQIWHAERRRPFWQSRLLALLMLVISVAILLITVGLQYVIPVFEHWKVPVWGHQLGQIRFVPTLVSVIVPLLLSTLLFGSIYRILPLRKVTWHSALPGALFAAIVWMVFTRLFGIYAVEIARYSIVYGTLGNPVLLISLFYFSALIMLAGAEIAAVYHHRLLLAGDADERQAEVEVKG